MESSPKEECLSSEAGIKRSCSDCKTTKTPLWRSGPSGPKSLCNACGIRYRKKRPTASTSKNDAKKGKTGKTSNMNMKIRDAVKVNLNLKPLWKEVEDRRSPVKRPRSPRQWGEVERAALLLMALSCGAVFA